MSWLMVSYTFKFLLILLLLLVPYTQTRSQDTFSIVAVDTVTGEIGSAGASCVGPIGGIGAFILSDVIEGIGAIHTQAYYLSGNQNNAHAKMIEGLSPQEIIDWLVANDVQGNPTIRQYGIVDLTRNGESASYTGVNCDDYKNHETGPGYAIQGNILMGQNIIDTMKYGFLNTNGPLADKLMNALESAKIVGADTRCAPRGTSSQSSFIKVVRIGDGNSPYLEEFVPDSPVNVDPIDILKEKFNLWKESLYTTVDPFLSEASLDTGFIPADGISQAVLTIIPKNNSDTLLASGLSVVVSNSGEGVVDNVVDLGNGSYQALITSPVVEGTDTFSIIVINGADTVNLASNPVLEYIDASYYEEVNQIPGKFILFQNYPNPFNPSTEIRYSLVESSEIKILIFSPIGEKIKTLVNQFQTSGEYKVHWDGTDEKNKQVSGGVYYYRIITGFNSLTKKMIKLQ